MIEFQIENTKYYRETIIPRKLLVVTLRLGCVTKEESGQTNSNY